MASWYERKNSPYIWLKWFDPQQGIYIRESTNTYFRPSKMGATPCIRGTKDGIKTAKQICDEIESTIKYNIAMSHFPAIKSSLPIGNAFVMFKNINRNKNKSTIRNYMLFFEVFKKTFNEKDPVSSINKQLADLWLSSVQSMRTHSGKIFSQNYVYGFQKNLKKFLGFLFENEYLKPFKISKDVQVNIELVRKIIFSADHINKIFDNLGKTNSNFKVCIYLLTYTGLRPTDILSINAEDIDLKSKIFQYYSPKLKKHITVPIHPKLLPALKERLSVIRKGKIIEYSTHNALAHAFNKYLQLLKIDGFGYTPRTFRKSFDTWAYGLGMDTTANSRLVGHSITTAEKHYREVYMNSLRIELNKFELPSKKQQKRK